MKRNNILLYVCLLSVLTCNVVFSQTKNKPKIIALPGFGYNINNNNTFQLTQENRFYYNTTDNLLSYGEFGISGKLLVGQIRNLYYTMTISYLHTLDNDFNTIEYRPKYYVTAVYNKNKFRFSIRNRIEYILKDDESGSLRYRPRFKLGFVYKLQDFRLYPYIYDELLFDENGFDQHRIKLALSARYEKIQIHIGNLFIFNANSKFVENRISLELGYRLKFKSRKSSRGMEENGVDPLYP